MYPTLTLNVSGITSPRTLAAIERAERMGLDGIWIPTMGVGPDALTTLAAAAVRTQRVTLGTGVLPAFIKHPLALAQQALAVDALAPGRLQLGIGTSHAVGMTGTYGVDMARPLARLREYVTVLKSLFDTGSVYHDGTFVTAHARIAAPVPVAVSIAALSPRAFALAGEVADGAVSWLCPSSYLLETALPAMQAGAERASRPLPRLIAGLPLAVSTDIAAVRATVRTQLANYVRTPFYQNMLVTSGLPEAREGLWSDAMVESVVLVGDEAAIADRLAALAAAGVHEVAVTPVLVGDDPRAAMQRTLSLLGDLVKQRDAAT